MEESLLTACAQKKKCIEDVEDRLQRQIHVVQYPDLIFTAI